ncbi:MAG: Ig-like domain-containing protein [Kofleriaceae bacterium]
MRFYVAACLFAMVGMGCSEDGDPIRLNVEDVNVSTPEDTPINASVDVDSNRAVSAQIVTQPTHGDVTTTGSGEGTTYTYTPDPDYNGPDSIVVSFSFADKTEMATINITVTPVNDSPVAGPDSFAANFETPATFQTSAMLTNDTDSDSSSLTITGVSSGLHGTVTLEGNTVSFVPESGYNGPANFKYTLSDGSETTQGDVTVAVGNNTAPVANDDTGTTMEDAAVSITAAMLLANDTDAENQTLSVIAVGSPSHGTVAQVGSDITFTPDPNYSGAASFQYTVADGAGADVGLVNITVSAVNDAPTANADLAATAEDTALSLQAATLLANDTDIDEGDSLTVMSVDSATNGTVELAGSFVTFTPAADFSGTASFMYTISDGDATSTAKVTVTVGSSNDAPIAVDDAIMGGEDTIITVSGAMLAANDTDPDGNPLSVTGVSNASAGSVSFVNGTVSYTPPADFTGTATFNYVVADGTAQDTGTVTVTVLPVNDAPVAINDSVSTNEDTPLNINPLANDSDVDNAALMVMSTTTPAHGTVAIAGTVVTYTPDANYFGADSFSYVAADGSGGMATATVSINVVSVNDLPVAVPDAFTINEDVTSTLDVRLNDSDVDGNPLTITNLSTPSEGTVSVVGGNVRYVPVPNANGVVTFTYTINDGAGGSATAMVTVTILPVPDQAIAVDDSYSLITNDIFTVPVSVGVMVNDQFIDGGETVEIVDYPEYGDITLNPDGSFTYEVYDDCTELDSFTYRILDMGPSNTATVTFNINHAPYTSTRYFDVYEDNLLQVPGFGPYGFQYDLLEYSYDIDGDTLTTALLSGPAHAQSFTFNSDGSFEYLPTTGYVGDDSFTYTVSDGIAAPVTATAEIYVFQNCGGSGGSSCGSSVGPGPSMGDAMTHGDMATYMLEDFEDSILRGKSCCYALIDLPPGTIAGGKGCYYDLSPAPSVDVLEASDSWWQ